MRRAVAMAVLAAFMLLVAGCWSRVEVNDLAIASMLGIDRTEGGDLQLWLHIVVPAGAGAAAAGAQGGGGHADSPAFITITATGKTVLEASRKLQLQLPRRLFWAHIRVVVIGERLARAGVRPVLDFLTRHRELRLTNYMLVCRSDMPTFMKARADLERLPGESLRETLRSFTGSTVTVGDFTRMLASAGADPVLGVAVIMSSPEGAPTNQSPTLRIAGTALFRDDKLVGYLDDRETRGLLWLQNRARHGVLSLTMPGLPGYISMAMINAEVERSARLEGNRVVMHVKASAEGDIGEESAQLDLSDPAVIRQLEDRLAGEVRDYMQTTLDRQRALNVDAAGFGDIVRQDLPRIWKPIEKRWLRQEARKLKVTFNVRVRIRRTGLSSKPRGVREDELIQKGR